MKFSEFKYERPDLDIIIEDIESLVTDFEKSESFEEALASFEKVLNISENFNTAQTLCEIRNNINTADEFYENEQAFFDENLPLFQNAMNKFYKVLVKSKFRKRLENIYSKQYFTQIELGLKCFDEKIMPELVEEAKLCTKFSKLLASAKIEFNGKIHNLSQMGIYNQNPDRNIRKAALLKTTEFRASIQAEIDDIYDKLVKTRDSMAKKMGFANYVDFGYLRLGRSDYNSQNVANYRKSIVKYLVPTAAKIFESQAKRLGINDLKFYDLSYFYADGNPQHNKNKDELVASALKFYSELSKETKNFFEFMLETELMDLEAKPNKSGGGFCTFISKYNSPFIFSNFRGDMGDVDVLTHEAGHAFEVYTASKHLAISDIYWPTMEACEIHSMSMEFFAYPYMNYFFGDDAKKYRFKHLSEAITFVPYGACVDEFQHFVYENPLCGKEARRVKWLELEKKYLPWRDYAELKFYAEGNFWHCQSHIFQNAFYYIDYTLAQVCAFQLLLLDKENHEKAWQKYYSLCKLGGSMSFTELVKAAGLKNPFVESTLADIMPKLEEYLNILEQEC